jgi:hypothetical protein
MKYIISEKVDKKWLNLRRKNKAKLTQYWKNIYPMDYVRDLVAKSEQKQI